MRLVRTLKASTTISADENIDFSVPSWAVGMLLHFDISAVAGNTPILDAKLQYKDPISQEYLDVTGASFSQRTSAIGDNLAVDPRGTTAANEVIAKPLSQDMRLVIDVDRTTGDETYTISVAAEFYS